MSDSCDLMDCSPPGASVHGIFQEEYWSGLLFPSPGDLPNPGIESRSPRFTDRLFMIELQQFSVTILNNIVWYTCNLLQELILSVLTTKTVIAMCGYGYTD